MAARSRPIVTLLSDFGVVDEYVASMKGVVLTRCRDATLVDISHDVPAGDVMRGALVLAGAAGRFPEGAIHVAVVDPGVGTRRAALLIDAGDRLFIGPDNGLLSLAAGASVRTYRLDREEFFCRPVSATFHGRDVFASVAGHLAAGRRPDEVGTAVTVYERISLPVVTRTSDAVFGEILYTDAFGNLITNILARDLQGLGATVAVEVGGTDIGPLCRTYADVAPGTLLALIGSNDRIEIARSQGRADTALAPDASPGTRVKVAAQR